jgi:splicing factor 3B subunit 3
VLRLPDNASDQVDNPSGSRILWDQGLLNGAPTKLELLAHYHIGELATSIAACSLIPGGKKVVVAATVMGGLYAFLPLEARDDIDFFSHLEMFMRQETASLCKREHLSYRSYFYPVKNTVDGDLCEKFSSLPYAKQIEFADTQQRTPAEVMKKLEDVRNSLM